MNTGFSSHLRCALLVAGLAIFFPLSGSFAGNQAESFTPSLMSAPGQEDMASLNQRLQTVKKDLEIFRTFAEHFGSSGETEVLSQLQTPLDDYLRKHVNILLEQSPESITLESTRLTAEVLFVKARILMALNRGEDAQSTISDMKKRFAPYQKITIQAPEKTTTLDEAIRQLEEELSKTTFTKKS